ncbi:hypothetical protein BaRGS_00028362 [Batillaria attramentaria]|uniref:Uncharacterized protein n=1 Tax=Batillaria attramentaria TaxID=370345 RepID=A0ABD0K062_9CAEN
MASASLVRPKDHDVVSVCTVDSGIDKDPPDRVSLEEWRGETPAKANPADSDSITRPLGNSYRDLARRTVVAWSGEQQPSLVDLDNFDSWHRPSTILYCVFVLAPGRTPIVFTLFDNDNRETDCFAVAEKYTVRTCRFLKSKLVKHNIRFDFYILPVVLRLCDCSAAEFDKEVGRRWSIVDTPNSDNARQWFKGPVGLCEKQMKEIEQAARKGSHLTIRTRRRITNRRMTESPPA